LATSWFSPSKSKPLATVGMATRVYLPDRRVTNLVMLSQKLFIAQSIEQFIMLVGR
jgi:catalase